MATVRRRHRTASPEASAVGKIRTLQESISEMPASENAVAIERKATVSGEPRKRRIAEVVSVLPADAYKAAAQKTQLVAAFRSAQVFIGEYSSPDMSEKVEVSLAELIGFVRNTPVEQRGALKEVLVNFRDGKTITARDGHVEPLPDPHSELEPVRPPAAPDLVRQAERRATVEAEPEDPRPASTPGNFSTRAPLSNVPSSPPELPSSGPRLVTADELFRNVPPSQRSKPRQKYQFAPDLLNDPEALSLAKSIANARNYKVRKGIAMAEEEDARGKMAESFVKQAERRQRQAAGGTPIPSPG
jgi:hypothetical protein